MHSRVMTALVVAIAIFSLTTGSSPATVNPLLQIKPHLASRTHAPSSGSVAAKTTVPQTPQNGMTAAVNPPTTNKTSPSITNPPPSDNVKANTIVPQTPKNGTKTGNSATSQHLPAFITAILTTSVVLFGFVGQI